MFATAGVFAVGGGEFAAGKRISVSGEIIDSWRYPTEITAAEGRAHDRCAIWRAAGEIPVCILDHEGRVEMVTRCASICSLTVGGYHKDRGRPGSRRHRPNPVASLAVKRQTT